MTINHVTALQGSGTMRTNNIQVGNKEQTMGKDDFLKLLLVQMQHQDPLNPVLDHEFVSQMAQFSSLEQMLQMNSSLSLFVKSQEYMQLSTFIGKEATIMHPETGREYTAEITGVRFGEKPTLIMGDLEVRWDRLLAIKKIANEQG